jgi:hypothetical protein
MAADSVPIRKRMRLRYAATCLVYKPQVAARETAYYLPDLRQVECLGCADEAAAETATAVPADCTAEANEPSTSDQPPIAMQSGTAGASARREYERRVLKREERIRSAHPEAGRADPRRHRRAAEYASVGNRCRR